MKIRLSPSLLVLVFYTVTVVAANALPVKRNVFSRRVFTSIGVSGAHRAFTTKNESNKEVEKKKEKNVTTAETYRQQVDTSLLVDKV
jgi:hypothetical protein